MSTIINLHSPKLKPEERRREDVTVKRQTAARSEPQAIYTRGPEQNPVVAEFKNAFHRAVAAVDRLKRERGRLDEHVVDECFDLWQQLESRSNKIFKEL